MSLQRSECSVIDHGIHGPNRSSVHIETSSEFHNFQSIFHDRVYGVSLLLIPVLSKVQTYDQLLVLMIAILTSSTFTPSWCLSLSFYFLPLAYGCGLHWAQQQCRRALTHNDCPSLLHVILNRMDAPGRRPCVAIYSIRGRGGSLRLLVEDVPWQTVMKLICTTFRWLSYLPAVWVHALIARSNCL